MTIKVYLRDDDGELESATIYDVLGINYVQKREGYFYIEYINEYGNVGGLYAIRMEVIY